MGRTPKKKRNNKLKFDLAIEAITGKKTIVQLASENDTHPRQIQRWIKKLRSDGPSVFTHKKTQEEEAPEMEDSEKEDLLGTIDELKEQLEFLKKKLKNNSP
jgi:transposase-like protein